MNVRLAGATVVALVAVPAAAADSTPVGQLPSGPATTVATRAGELVAVALPHRSGGRVWRIARSFDPKIVRQVSEGDVGPNVVLVFKSRRAGTVRLSFALTRGDTGSKALEARTFIVRVR
jgi:hypothetical protein